MRAKLIVVAVLLACAAAAAIGARPHSSSAITSCSADNSIDSEELAFLGLINNYRQQNGLGMLALSDTLDRAASWKSNDMGVNAYFAHDDTPTGRTWVQRLQDCGYTYNTWIGENIAAGISDAATAFSLWRNSPGHNANMLGQYYTTIGIGRAYVAGSPYGWYWTTDFGGYSDGYSGGATPAPTATPTRTNTPTATPTRTPTNTPAATATPTRTPTNTLVPPTNTPVPPTNTLAPPTNTPAATATPTRTPTNTPPPTATQTPAPASTNTPPTTPTPTRTPTNTPPATPTQTPAPASTSTPVPPTDTPTATRTNTATPTRTNTPPPTSTHTPVPPPASYPCADVSGDGMVTLVDVVIVLGLYRSTDALADFDHDGHVLIGDVIIVLRQYGTHCSRTTA